jgi:hypothetical protein
MLITEVANCTIANFKKMQRELASTDVVIMLANVLEGATSSALWQPSSRPP